MSIDQLGPYTIEQLKEIADDIDSQLSDYVRPLIGRALEAGQQPGLVYDVLSGGRPVILLWRSSPMWGHYIGLIPRPGRDLELFDPLGGGSEASDAARYVSGDKALNGPQGWIGRVLDHWARNGGTVSYNVGGPQSTHADSCGAWALMRTIHRAMRPSEFASYFRGK